MAKSVKSKRSCGVLMPVFSLPSKYGIGTFSKEAYEFVDFLAKDSVIATMEERGNFNGFTKLVEDVNNSSDKLGYPKHATITGNNFYGNKVNNSDYLSLAAHVTSWALAYKDNNSSTTVPAYDIPECGARN